MGDAASMDDVKARSLHQVYKGAASPFEFCQYKCRTSSASVIHENSYRSAAKHCYGAARPRLLPAVSVNSDMSIG